MLADCTNTLVEALEAEVTQYRELVTHASDGIVVVQDGKFVFRNPQVISNRTGIGIILQGHRQSRYPAFGIGRHGWRGIVEIHDIGDNGSGYTGSQTQLIIRR